MERSPAEIVWQVLRRARDGMPKEGGRAEAPDGAARAGKAGAEFGKAWLGALGRAFEEVYPAEDGVTVFSQGNAPKGPGAAWRRNEYLFDVSVVRFGQRPGPVRTDRQVPYVKGAIWQVESEIEGSFSALAEDLGKLVLGRARWSLLVTVKPGRESDLSAWTEAIAQIAQPLGDSLFVAFVHSYAAASRTGWAGRPIELRRMWRDPAGAEDGWRLVPLGTIPAGGRDAPEVPAAGADRP